MKRWGWIAGLSGIVLAASTAVAGVRAPGITPEQLEAFRELSAQAPCRGVTREQYPGFALAENTVILAEKINAFHSAAVDKLGLEDPALQTAGWEVAKLARRVMQNEVPAFERRAGRWEEGADQRPFYPIDVFLHTCWSRLQEARAFVAPRRLASGEVGTSYWFVSQGTYSWLGEAELSEVFSGKESELFPAYSLAYLTQLVILRNSYAYQTSWGRSEQAEVREALREALRRTPAGPALERVLEISGLANAIVAEDREEE